MIANGSTIKQNPEVVDSTNYRNPYDLAVSDHQLKTLSVQPNFAIFTAFLIFYL